jgi:hypothetical protein
MVAAAVEPLGFPLAASAIHLFLAARPIGQKGAGGAPEKIARTRRLGEPERSKEATMPDTNHSHQELREAVRALCAVSVSREWP